MKSQTMLNDTDSIRREVRAMMAAAYRRTVSENIKRGIRARKERLANAAK